MAPQKSLMALTETMGTEARREGGGESSPANQQNDRHAPWSRSSGKWPVYLRSASGEVTQ